MDFFGGWGGGGHRRTGLFYFIYFFLGGGVISMHFIGSFLQVKVQNGIFILGGGVLKFQKKYWYDMFWG